MKKNLELYLHIPFCITKCAYCDFISAPADDETRAKYVAALIQEINGYKGSFCDYQVNTVFVGGGTPSILTEQQVADVFEALRQSFEVFPQAEITLEANPGTVTDSKLRVWKDSGINRLSLGLQSADDRELKILGRIHTVQDFRETCAKARNAGFENINIDLISGIPGQSPESFERTLHMTAGCHPEHISAYSLIVEEGTPFGDIYGPDKTLPKDCSQWPPLPDEESDRRMYEQTETILNAYGYFRYEISNYAKPGFECRHNCGYWEREEYLGIGLGAASLINNSRFHQTADLNTYIEHIKAGKRIRQDLEILSQKEQMEEFMYLGLREMRGVSPARFRQYFSRDIYEVYGEQILKLKKQALLEVDGDSVFLTKRGIDISNYVLAEFLL